MRRLIFIFVLVSWPLRLEAEPATGKGFWEQMVGPEKEVEDVLRHASELFVNARRTIHGGQDEALRTRMLGDARAMLRYALELAPDDSGVLALLASVEGELGHVKRALELYRRYGEVTQPGAVSGDVCLDHSLLLARSGARDAAVSKLQGCVYALPSRRDGVSHRTLVLVHLAGLYADQGRMGAAIELLSRHAGARSGDLLTTFALAVAYDKDEQNAAAFAVVEDMLATYPRDSLLELGMTLSGMEFVPAADRHYFVALFYEIAGYLLEARAEWQAYTLHGDEARHGRRARAHIMGIDALLRSGNASGQ